MQDRATRLAADDVLLLPWHATGRLPSSQACSINSAIVRNTNAAQQFAVVLQERAEIIAINEQLGTPSPRAVLALFAAIDNEPRKKWC